MKNGQRVSIPNRSTYFSHRATIHIDVAFKLFCAATDLWVWNAPRGGFPGSPKNAHVVEKNRKAGRTPNEDNQKKASFANTNTDDQMKDAKLYFQDTFWADLGWGKPVSNVNTFEGHQWNVKVGEKTVKTFIITKEEMQRYTI